MTEEEFKNSKTFNYFEDFYNNTFKRETTFAPDMQKKVQEELGKMLEQREEWLKAQKKS